MNALCRVYLSAWFISETSRWRFLLPFYCGFTVYFVERIQYQFESVDYSENLPYMNLKWYCVGFFKNTSSSRNLVHDVKYRCRASFIWNNCLYAE